MSRSVLALPMGCSDSLYSITVEQLKNARRGAEKSEISKSAKMDRNIGKEWLPYE